MLRFHVTCHDICCQVKLSLSLDGEPHLYSEVDHLNALVTSDIVDFFLNSVSAKLADVNGVELR